MEDLVQAAPKWPQLGSGQVWSIPLTEGQIFLAIKSNIYLVHDGNQLLCHRWQTVGHSL